MNHKLLHLHSLHKDQSSESNSDFRVNFTNYDFMQHVKSVVVKQISFPHIFYNIDESNRTFTYKIASVPTSVQIPIGQYTVAELITALQGAAALVGLTIIQSSVTRKLSFTTTTDIQYLPIAENDMADVLGLTTGTVGDVSNYTALGFTDLRGIKNVKVVSEALGTLNLITSESKLENVLAVIPITQEFAAMEYYVSTHTEIDDFDTISQKHGKNVQIIDIKLVDLETNRVIDLANHHVDIVLKIYY